MRSVDFRLPAQNPRDLRLLAALTRHLNARLLDFGPDGPEVISFDETHALVKVRFPGHDTAKVLHNLSLKCGVQAAAEAGFALFYLNESISFEDLDYVWGCLFDLLSE